MFGLFNKKEKKNELQEYLEKQKALDEEYEREMQRKKEQINDGTV